MAQTWQKKKRGRVIRSDPLTRVDALAARRVLRDCYRAKTRFDTATIAADRRLWWILALTLLRAVGHVLNKVDSKRSRYLANSIRKGYLAWKAEPRQHLVFHEFIEKERNEIIKEYRIDPAISLNHDASDRVPGLLLIGDAALTPGAALASAIRWWEDQLAIIEEEAAGTLTAARAEPAGRHEVPVGVSRPRPRPGSRPRCARRSRLAFPPRRRAVSALRVTIADAGFGHFRAF